MLLGKSGTRLIRFALLGIFAGLFLLSSISILFYSNEYNRASEDLARQENLTPARGEALEEYGSVNVTVRVLVNGKVADNISVSPDGHRWYTPEDGELILELIPGGYSFKAFYENRQVSADITVSDGGENSLVLDVGKAPEAPEFLILEAEGPETFIYPLDIYGADTVSISSSIDYIRVLHRSDGYYLEAEVSALPYDFYPLTLYSENEWGKSETHVGLQLPRNEEVIPIYTVEDLSSIRKSLSGCYKLMNDLDMSEIHDWTPIGLEEYPFTGVFDGGGFEITGLHAPDVVAENGGFALFYYVSHAEISNVIIREPYIAPQNADSASFCAALVARARFSIVENCAVIDGLIAPNAGAASGVMCDSSEGIVLSLFNSANVTCSAPNDELPHAAGVCGGISGYGAYLANEGAVFGTHLTGGVAGFQNVSYVTRCVNIGYIWGSTMIGEYPVGGISQTLDYSYLSDCYFLAGQSPIGASAFTDGYIRSLTPVSENELRTPSAMPLLGSFEGDDPDWTYASLDARGPVPNGIFKQQAEEPAPVLTDNQLVLPVVEGLVYFYTLDGSDPRVNCPKGVSSAEFDLSAEEKLTVYAARQGCYDSAVLIFTMEGGRINELT